MTSGDEMESALDIRVEQTLRGGVTSTEAARQQVMAAVRAAPRPAAGVGDIDDEIAGPAASSRVRSLWRSPALLLLAAASVAGFIALIRAAGIEGPIAEVPGQHAVARRASAQPEIAGTVSPAAAGPATATIGAPRPRLAKVQFVLVAPQARRVVVVGDFNDWDPAAAPLAATGGVWSREMDVPFGRHDYAFVVDGDRWMPDPSAPRAPADEFGAGYSVIVVGENR